LFKKSNAKIVKTVPTNPIYHLPYIIYDIYRKTLFTHNTHTHTHTHIYIYKTRIYMFIKFILN